MRPFAILLSSTLLLFGCTPRRSTSPDAPLVVPVATSASAAASPLDARVGRPHPPLHLLPSTTTQVRELLIQYTGEKELASRHLFTDAYLGSHFCVQEHPEPVFALLTPSRVEATLATDRLPVLRTLLACGAAFEPKLRSPYVTTARFIAPGGAVDVRFVQLDLQELPSELGFVPTTIDGLPGYCQSEATGGCHFQAIRYATTWMFGRAAAIQTIAQAMAAEAGSPSSNVFADDLEALPPSMQRYVSLTAKPPGALLRNFLGTVDELRAASSSSMLPRDVEVELDALAATGVVSGYSFERPTVSGGVRGTYALLADTDDAASSLEPKVQSIVARWKAQVPVSAGGPVVRALQSVSPSRVGRALLLTFAEPLTAQEATTFTPYERQQDESKVVVAQILDAVVRGDPPPAASVERLARPDRRQGATDRDDGAPQAMP